MQGVAVPSDSRVANYCAPACARQTARITYAPENVRVNSVRPGLIRTPLVEAQSDDMNAAIIKSTPMDRMGTPEGVTAGCVFLASDDASFMTVS